EDRSLVEPRLCGVLSRRREDYPSYAAPQRRTEAHRARLARREEVVARLGVVLQREAPNGRLRHRERDDLGVCARIVESDHAVRADADEAAGIIEDRRTKRPPCSWKDVLSGGLGRQANSRLVIGVATSVIHRAAYPIGIRYADFGRAHCKD